MTKRLFLAACAVSALLFVTVNAEEEKFAANCPVSGQAAKKDSSVDYKGKKVYFCCNNCPKAFKEDTKKYAAKAHHQLLQTKQIVQVACPLTGRDLNAETAIDVKGVKVAFCCNNCKGKAQKSEEQVAMIFENLDKGFTLQTSCPVSGKAIDAKKVVEYKGKKVYFCCGNCPAKFQAKPEDYLDKLPQFQKEDKKS